MKRLIIFIVLLIILGALLFGSDSNITKIGGWGTGDYNDVFTRAKYAYIAANNHGLDILDISNPSKPALVGNTSLDSRNSRAMAVYVDGNYAYLACSDGLHIVDVSIPTSPQVLGFYSIEKYYDMIYLVSANVKDVIVDGNYAYLMLEYSYFEHCIIDILDVSNPAQPQSTGQYIYFGDSIKESDLGFLHQENKSYLFFNDDMMSDLEIWDVSNPLSPQHKKTINSVDRYSVKGNYVYIIYGTDLKIFNIEDPTNPQQVGTCSISSYAYHIYVAGNYLFLAEETDWTQDTWQIQIIDISNPTAPVVSGSCPFSGDPKELTVTGGTALAAERERGLYIFDVSKPTSPRFLKNYDFSWSPFDIVVEGSRAYVVDNHKELYIFDISAPSSPVILGKYLCPETIAAISLIGNYAYLTTWGSGLEIINVKDPTRPVKEGVFFADYPTIKNITINGNYAYCNNDYYWFYILDLANPLEPVLLSKLKITTVGKIHIDGNYAFQAGDYGADVIDITNPTAPVVISNFYGSSNIRVGSVCSQGAYVYVANNNYLIPSLDIFDFNRPSSPERIGRYMLKDSYIYDLCINDNYVYLVASSGLYVIDAAHPSSPTAAGYLAINFVDSALTVQGKYIYLTTGYAGRFEILEFKVGKKPSQLRVNRNSLTFNADQAKNISAPQSFFIDTIGDNNLAWSLDTLKWDDDLKIDWIICSQVKGVGNAEISVAIDPIKVRKMLKDKPPVTDVGCITISAPNALNSELKIRVSIQIDKVADSNQPFGELSSPTGNTIVSGSVPVTGWALDNIDVTGVQIYRKVGEQLFFIGDAVFVEGARPDVEIQYPDHPNCFKAGWGYMLLTQGLPGGDGPLTLHAVATDIEGNRVTLGTTAVTIANTNSAKPFGALDTPGQGETISGQEAINFGWALTPLPNTIPTDGSTIRVWIDGVEAGQPVYNQYRKDLAEQFPGLNNSSGAVGYFVLDTTRYNIGIHTIAWSVEDDAGNADGIGSRYFQVWNNTSVSACDPETADRRFSAPINPLDMENAEIDRQPVQFKTGFNPDRTPDTAVLSQQGVSTITIHQLERMEIDLGVSAGAPGENISGYLLVGNTYRPLPIGSTLDAQKGIFYWQPGPGFIGTYDFIFVKANNNLTPVIKKFQVNIAVN